MTRAVIDVNALWDLGLRVDDSEDIPTVTRDPDDDYLIALSRTSEADVLVTGDRDLLATSESSVQTPGPPTSTLRGEGWSSRPSTGAT